MIFCTFVEAKNDECIDIQLGERKKGFGEGKSMKK